MSHRHDVLVVGAGLAGLGAARALHTDGFDVLVLEARDRVGGKTHSTHTASDDVVEYGGQWVGADQDRVLALVDEFDIDTRPQYHEGTAVTRLGDERVVTDSYVEAYEALPDDATDELHAAFDDIASAVSTVPTDRPQDAPNAAVWDAMTLASWADDRFETDEAQAAFERMIPGIYTADPGDISFLFFLHYAATAGGFDMVAGLAEDADSHASVVVDVNAIARSLAAPLGDRVRTGHPVSHVAQDEDGVVATTPEGAFEARRAIVALPPALAGRLQYEPVLPASRDELTQRFPGARVIKCHLRYDTPFWRGEGFSGIAEDTQGPANYYFDDGVPGGETGRLVGFICGSAARRWSDASREERRNALTDQLAGLFADDRFATPIDYLEHDWTSDPHARGAYHCYPTPGTITACWDAIRTPVGRLHWASAETATRWYGHMDGAIRAGERAANDVRDRMA